jgi:hypothetical protein
VLKKSALVCRQPSRRNYAPVASTNGAWDDCSSAAQRWSHARCRRRVNRWLGATARTSTTRTTAMRAARMLAARRLSAATAGAALSAHATRSHPPAPRSSGCVECVVGTGDCAAGLATDDALECASKSVGRTARTGGGRGRAPASTKPRCTSSRASRPSSKALSLRGASSRRCGPLFVASSSTDLIRQTECRGSSARS